MEGAGCFACGTKEQTAQQFPISPAGNPVSLPAPSKGHFLCFQRDDFCLLLFSKSAIFLRKGGVFAPALPVYSVPVPWRVFLGVRTIVIFSTESMFSATVFKSSFRASFLFRCRSVYLRRRGRSLAWKAAVLFGNPMEMGEKDPLCAPNKGGILWNW